MRQHSSNDVSHLRLPIVVLKGTPVKLHQSFQLIGRWHCQISRDLLGCAICSQIFFFVTTHCKKKLGLFFFKFTDLKKIKKTKTKTNKQTKQNRVNQKTLRLVFLTALPLDLVLSGITGRGRGRGQSAP